MSEARRRATIDLASFDKDSDWREGARCVEVDPELFFPLPGGHPTKEIWSVCGPCEVREKCLEYALRADEQYGYWGGVSPEHRLKITKAAGGRQYRAR